MLRGEGKTKVNGVIRAYNIFYTALVDGREMYGRDVLLLPERRGAREGVEIVMLTTPGEQPRATTRRSKWAPRACCFRPLKTFTLG